MTETVYLVFRAYFITVMTVGMMVSLTEFRFEKKKLLVIFGLYSLWVVGSSFVLVWLGGELLLIRLFYLTISVPATFLTYWAANDAPAQAVFNYMTQILLSVLAVSAIRLVTEDFGLSRLANILMMLVFYVAAIALEWRFLRRPFRMLIRVIPVQWEILTLIPCTFCIYLIFVASWPGSYHDSIPQRGYIFGALLPMIVVYVAVFKSLISQYRIHIERQSAALLTVQINALQEKLQKVKEVEDAVRIQRHDLRHQLHTVTELVARGEQEAALAFLDTARQQLHEQKTIHWCRPPVLDAMFTTYFDQAERDSIPVEAKISLPDVLPVDEGGLAMVLANAMENAIHANRKLPQTQRYLHCKVVGTPSIMMELTNPCPGAVTFDDRGLPISREEGHGIGVQSIAAFCRKNGAVCQFEVKNGVFRFRLVL